MKGDYYQKQKLAEEVAAIRKLWIESEYRLQFLRTNTGKPVKEPSDEELRQWKEHCQPQTL